MTTKPLAEVTEEAFTLLYRELGVIGTVRFLSQYRTGYSDYTSERGVLFADLTIEDIASYIESDSS